MDNETQGIVAIEVEELEVDEGEFSTAIAIDTLAEMNINLQVEVDDPRRVATEAKVRLIHGSPAAGNVDIWITAVGGDITMEDPAFTDVALGGSTGYVGLAEGSYDVNIAPTGTTVAAITQQIDVILGGVYTAIARDAEGGMGGLPLGLILMDDFAP